MIPTSIACRQNLRILLLCPSPGGIMVASELRVNGWTLDEVLSAGTLVITAVFVSYRQQSMIHFR